MASVITIDKIDNDIKTIMKEDRRKYNRGHKGVSGRKPKKAEVALVEKLSIYDEVAQTKLFELIEQGEFKAIQLFYAYRYGKPVETKNVIKTKEVPIFNLDDIDDAELID